MEKVIDSAIQAILVPIALSSMLKKFSLLSSLLLVAFGAHAATAIPGLTVRVPIDGLVVTVDEGASSPSGGSGTDASTAFQMSPSALNFPYAAIGSRTPAQTVTVTNTGTAAGSLGSPLVTGPFALLSSSCATSLGAGQSCNLSVDFSPTTEGAATGSLSLVTQSGSYTATLTGFGTQMSGSVSAGALSFGDEAVGAISAAQAVSVTNTGNTALAVGSVSASGPFSVSYSCPASLDAGGSCLVNVAFEPTAEGPQNGTLLVATGAGNYTVNLTGTGLQANVSAAPYSVTFADQLVGTTSSAQQVVLTNTGNTATSLSPPSVTGPFAVNSTTCGASLAAGANCTVNVTFSPVQENGVSGELSVVTGAGVQAVNLSGNGLQTSANVAPTVLSFNGQAVSSTSAAQNVTVTNTGNTPLPISSISASGPFAETQTCPATLPVGGNCTINVSFSPSASGPQNGSLNVVTMAATYTTSLSGMGLQAALSLSPSTLLFNNQNVGTTSTSQTVTLTNSGNAASSLSPATVTGPFSVAGTTCGVSLSAGESCTYALTFTPTVMSEASGVLSIPTGSGAQAVTLGGYGLLSSASTTAGSLDFGNQKVGAASVAQTLTLSNTGNTTLGITSISTNGQFNASQSCGSSIPAGGSCTVNVWFSPTSMGAQNGTLSMVTSAATYSVGLTGTGMEAVLAAAPATVSFSNQTVNTTSVAQTVTLTNAGNQTANLSTATVTGPFSIASTTCNASLAPSSSCTYDLKFSPTATGAASGALTVPTDSGNQSVALSGTGQNPPSNCAGILASNPSATSGLYALTVAGTQLTTYCDMQTDGGGWTLVGNQVPSAAGWTVTTADINPAQFGNVSATWRFGNTKIQAMTRSTGWRITSDSGSSVLNFTEKDYFQPSCVISWVQTYNASTLTNSMPTACQQAFTSTTFASRVSASVANNGSLGIGQNNSGAYCSVRFAHDPNAVGTGIYDEAYNCSMSAAGRMQLWVR